GGRLDVHHHVHAAVAEAEQRQTQEHHGVGVQDIGSDPDHPHARGHDEQRDQHPLACAGAGHDGGTRRDADDRG
ncbi:hypothetical protein ABE10_01955, partial [Bacillus toyonensis]|nr:hypothetical protein [Bacillus toyonensis]